jgi:tyrosinase
MQSRPIANPISWRYQAAIHDYTIGADPLSVNGEALPSATEQKVFWRQCQHGSWFFLSWHRMYLWHFEQIVAKAVADLGGPADWALPYWNYSDTTNPNAQTLPPAFRDTIMKGGAPNPLRVEARAPACNKGLVIGDKDDVDLTASLTDDDFTTAAIGAGAGFGGPKTAFHHSPGVTGSVESTPHGSMHNKVGGGGWMSGFNSAPLDPIFWLHHANIDRLWEVWRLRNPAVHVNPTEKAWLTNVSFDFHDASGTPTKMVSGQVLDTTAAPLGYQYEDASDPISAVHPATIAPAVQGLAVTERPVPEMVAASEQPVLLGSGKTTQTLAVKAPTGPAVLSAGASGPRRIYLNLENVTGTGAPGGYGVYLNVPQGADPQQHPDRFAGILPMFGVAEASRLDSEHGGAGLHYVLNVSNLVNRLSAEPGWNPQALSVVFVYRGNDGPANAQVGRISLYYA